MPVSVAIHDSLSKSQTFIEHEDPEILVGIFVKELERRQALIVEEVNRLYPRPDDFDMLSKGDQGAWNEWVNQVAVIGFNSGKYDINMIKRYFVERIAENVNEEIKVAKKDNNYMFLTTSKFKFHRHQELSFSRDELRQIVQVVGVRAGKASVSLRVVDQLRQAKRRRACRIRELL